MSTYKLAQKFGLGNCTGRAYSEWLIGVLPEGTRVGRLSWLGDVLPGPDRNPSSSAFFRRRFTSVCEQPPTKDPGKVGETGPCGPGPALSPAKSAWSRARAGERMVLKNVRGSTETMAARA